MAFYMGSGNRTLVARLSQQEPLPLSHLAGPEMTPFILHSIFYSKIYLSDAEITSLAVVCINMVRIFLCVHARARDRVYMCVCACACVCVCVCVCVCRHYHTPPHFLRQDLSLNLKFAISVRIPDQEVPRGSTVSASAVRSQTHNYTHFYMSDGNQKSETAA